MFEPFKIDRKLPPHELNARRNRKRAVTGLPHIARLRKPNHDPDALQDRGALHDHDAIHDQDAVHHSPNHHVFNHGANPVIHHRHQK